MAKRHKPINYDELITFLETYGDQVVEEMRTRLRKHGKIASEALYDSIKSVVKNNRKDGITLSFELLDYYIFVDKGVNGIFRKVGSPYSFKTIYPNKKMARAIKQWKTIIGSNASVYGAVVNIKKKGIRPTQFYSISVNRRRKFMETKITELLFKALSEE